MVAYIGVNGTIVVNGSAVTNSLQGPVDVSTGNHAFSGLTSNTTYKIIVVAQNTNGYSVKQVVQSTAGIVSVMNNLSIGSVDSSSITINQPTFSTAGNPAPTVKAYIGVNVTISVSGSVVSNSIQGPIDVSTGSYQFAGLISYTTYKIIVIAENAVGYSVKEITQSTTGIAPVLNNLSISNFSTSTISVDQPTFSTAGNPAPTLKAYIGVSGTISVSGSVVSNSLQGPIDVSSGSYQFASLTVYTTYKIIVVAENAMGYSVKEIVQSTSGIVPVLNNLSIGNYTSSTVTLVQPTFSTAGNPTPSVNAYIGIDGTISISGSVVSNYLQGPIDVSSGDYQFNGLNLLSNNYRIITVTENASGFSVKEKFPLTSITTDNLVAYYPFSNNVNDESGYGNHGTASGTTPTSDRFGSTNSAYSFDGLNDYISITSTSTNNFSSSSAISISVWIKPGDIQTSGDRMIIGKSNYSSTTNYLFRLRPNGYLRWEYKNYSDTNSDALIANNWYHLVVNSVNSTGVKKMFINGNLITHQTATSSGAFGTVTNHLTIGAAYYFGTTWSEFFKGCIDDVRIYNRVLSDSEVIGLYKEGNWNGN